MSAGVVGTMLGLGEREAKNGDEVVEERFKIEVLMEM